jgi:hypothetical protein
MARLPAGSKVICMGGTVRLMTQRKSGDGGKAADGQPHFLPLAVVQCFSI